MSVSTDAILCYGFEVGEEEEPPTWLKPAADDEDSEADDFESFIMRFFGTSVQEPAEFNESAYDSNPSIRKQWRDYWAAKKALVDSVNVTLVHHCSREYPMYILAVKASVKTASRGTAVEITDTTMQTSWLDDLTAFCATCGIPMQEPKWLLVSYWG